MISWIQRSFHKHTKLVFFFLLVAVAVPFVFMGVWSGNGGPTVKLNKREFFHVNLGNEEQVRRMFNDADLSAQLKEGYNALQGAQLQQYAFQRVAGIALAEQLHLPAPSPEQVSAYVLTLRAFHNEQGQFDQSRYTQFSDMLKTGSGISGADVNRVLRDDARLAELGKVVGGPGYVLPFDVKQQLIRADSRWTVQVATLDYATFNPTIAVTDEVLKKFHADNEFRYEIPARPRLSYVEFKTADFIPPVAPSEAELRAFYNANQARFPVPAEAEKSATPSLSADGSVDNFPKVRAQVETALKDSAGLRLASKAATDLTVALYEQKIPANSAELTAFLAGQRRPAVAIAPFAPYAPPADMEWLGYYSDAFARLNNERFFTDPVQTPNGFAILFWSETLPAHKPLFNEVRDRVAADYQDAEKRKLFVERGRALQTKLQASAQSADAFTQAATAEKLDVKSYASFTLREQPPQDLPYPALSALQTLEQGKVSDMIATGDKGHLVFAQEKKTPDLTPANPRYAEIEQQLMAFTAGTNENSYLGRMVEAELKRTAPADEVE